MSTLDQSIPNLHAEQQPDISVDSFTLNVSQHKPRILLLYGSLRNVSYSRLVIEESARLLNAMGAETKIFNPEGSSTTHADNLPIPFPIREPSTFLLKGK